MLITVILGAFTACSDEILIQNDKPSTGVDGYYFVMSEPTISRAITYGSENTSTFSEGDEVGVFATDGSGNLYHGTEGQAKYKVKNVTGGQVLEPADETQKLPEGDDITYILYHPYSADMKLDKLENLTWTVKENQNPVESETKNRSEAYEQSDFLWDVVKQDADRKQVSVVMKHAMANIILKISKKLLSSGNAEVLIPLSPLSISGVNLTSVAAGADKTGYKTFGTESKNIKMWKWNEVTNNKDGNVTVTYRAVVPANRTINAGSEIFKLTAAGGSEKTLKLQSDLKLEEGSNYIFQVVSNETDIPVPVPSDDDSWVLDVYNKNNELVGLLCREYLRYQEKSDVDQPTGTSGNNPDGSDTKWINSQAWVLYNLKDYNGKKVPDLINGQVLRFIYDVEYQQYNLWPAPHKNKRMPGFFTPEHGRHWGGSTAEGYGTERDGEKQYYMHGGYITWNADEDNINSFILPGETNYVDNSTAKLFGHVTYDESNKKVEASYVTPEEDDNACYLTPHNLIDRRGNNEIKYPLVKIGFNQFWMSKSLNTEYLTTGERLTCYNDKNEAKQSFTDSDNEDIAKGFLYPFAKIGTDTYDPFHNELQKIYMPDEIFDGDNTKYPFEAVRMYNKQAVDDDNFVPSSDNENINYTMPTVDDIKVMLDYFGPYYFPKLLNRNIVIFNGESPRYGLFEAACRGEAYGFSDGTVQINKYTANISGFNLRSLGLFRGATSGFGFNEITATCALMLKTEDPDVCKIFNFKTYEAFKDYASLDENIETSKKTSNNYTSMGYHKFFAQVRFVMRFKGQDGGTSTKTRSMKKESGTNIAGGGHSHDVYIALDAPELKK